MKHILNRAVFILITCAMFYLPVEAQRKQVTHAAKKKEQVERDYKKAYAKARKRTIKHRYEIQSPRTKDMMDAAGKRAEAFNKQNDPDLLDRLFKRKRPRNR